MNRVVFPQKILPYILLAPQIAVTVIFFFWPASQAIYQSLHREDAFGLHSRFVGLAYFVLVLEDPSYLNSVWTTVVFSLATAFVAIAAGLVLAVMAQRVIVGRAFYRTMLI